ncbi:MAG: serine/threonine protein kinase [Polyangiaceae bacterium]|nr:serine/threonine protein kinase [Polyangiaceae bacterium]
MQGRVIAGRYRLERIEGRDAVGVVWRAEHLTLGIPIAVKLIRYPGALTPEGRARFEREAKLAARIRSAYVSRVVDFGLGADELFLVTEWLEGESLRARLASTGRLGLVETARALGDVCRALAAAHALGLVHCDIEPQNVLVARGEPGGRETYRLLDFAGPSVVGPADRDPALPLPYYLSPELAGGSPRVDYRADLWSASVTALECLTGQRPFEAAELAPLLAQIVRGDIRLPREVAPELALPPAIDDWARRALARAPAERYPSALELAAAFRTAAGVADD